MAKNLKFDESTEDLFAALPGKAKEEIHKQKEPKVETFKKPTGDYYRLDMVVRDTATIRKKVTTRTGTIERNFEVTTEKVKADYMDYIKTMAAAEGISITKYIHRLIDEDMAKNSKKYKQLKKIRKG